MDQSWMIATCILITNEDSDTQKKWKNHIFLEKATQGKNNIEVSIMIAIEALGSEVTGM
jgi:hypothetical protein